MKINNTYTVAITAAIAAVVLSLLLFGWLMVSLSNEYSWKYVLLLIIPLIYYVFIVKKGKSSRGEKLSDGFKIIITFIFITAIALLGLEFYYDIINLEGFTLFTGSICIVFTLALWRYSSWFK